MKAIVFDQPGDPRQVLQLRDMPIPEPPPGHVLVRMLASPINPSDLIFITGTYGLKPNLPATPGFEGVGIVERSGGGVLGWLRKGKRVAVLNDRTGNWREYTVVPARQVIPIPGDIDDEQAACFFVNPATALAMTEKVLRIPRAAWLLQSAAGSALGRMIIRLGKHAGFRTINIVRRPDAVEELKKLGGDEVICAEGHAITERVLALTNGEGVRYAIDPVGGETGSGVVASLAPQGRTLLYGLLSGQPVSVHPRSLLSGCKRVEGFLLSDWAKQQNVFTLLGVFRRVTKLMRAGILLSDNVQTHSMEDFSKAIEQAMAAGKPGKVVLRISS
ncbi:MAG: zinc-dependent alcohol dehydrogenase family protein [Planctomycetales bacterium]|nr:zinc-dependent alcohol dehydrogenase family protein [Planctomycetales bacterium]